jgi:dihydroorotase
MQDYLDAPSGLPLVQHSFSIMLEFYHQGKISLERIVEKMCHAPAVCFQVKERGFVREGYWADLVLFDLDHKWEVQKDNIFYKCGWSPLEGKAFKGAINKTLINGEIAYDRSVGFLNKNSQRLEFQR